MNEAYNIDCMEYMRTLPDKAFDLAVVDPPYGIDVCNMVMVDTASVLYITVFPNGQGRVRCRPGSRGSL